MQLDDQFPEIDEHERGNNKESCGVAGLNDDGVVIDAFEGAPGIGLGDRVAVAEGVDHAHLLVLFIITIALLQSYHIISSHKMVDINNYKLLK